VASNLYSIAEAQFYPKATAYCVFTNDEMVGFTTFGIDEDKDNMLWIDRLMIAEPFLGQGYGVEVLQTIVDKACSFGVTVVGTSTAPENIAAKRAFEKAGFIDTDIKRDGQDVYYHYVPYKSTE
jgi:diamine N-acetyltransferase